MPKYTIIYTINFSLCENVFPMFLQHAKRVDEEAKIKLGPVVIAPVEEHSDDKRGKTRMDAERVERVATSFLQEKSRLGPLMFIPGQVLHLEEGEKDCDGASAGLVTHTCTYVHFVALRALHANAVRNNLALHNCVYPARVQLYK